MSDSVIKDDTTAKPETDMETNSKQVNSILGSSPQTEFSISPQKNSQPVETTNPDSTKEPKTDIEPTTNNEPKSPSDAVQFDPNDKPGFKDLSKTSVVLSNIKTDVQTKDIVINLEKESAGLNKGDGKKDFLVYEYYGQHIRPQRNYWVMYEGGGGGGGIDGSRSDFVRLVFLILFIMLSVTAFLVIMVHMVDPLSDFFLSHGFMLAIGSSIVLIGLSYSIACSPCTRVFPGNVIVLTLAVLCMSVVCCFVTVRYVPAIPIMALAITCLVVLICFLVSLTSFDFTSWWLYVMMFSAAFGVLVLVYMVAVWAFKVYLKPLHIAIVVISTLLNVVCLTMEFQMVLGGKTIEISEEDYVLGAFMLYMSIVNIFMDCVRLLGLTAEDLF